MKNIKTKFIAMMLIVAMALTGCADYQVGLVINPDGSGIMSMEVKLDKEAYVEYVKSLFKSMGMEITDAELKEIDSTLTDSGYKLVTIDGKEFYQMAEQEKIQKGKLQKYFANENPSYVTTDTVYLKFKASDNTEMNEMMKEAEEMGIDIPENAMIATMTVEMPKPVVKTNGTVDAENPNKVTFSLDFTKDTVIFVTTKSGVTINSVKATIKKLNTIKAPKITKLKADKVAANAKKATATLKFRKVKVAKKYEIQYSTKKNFKNAVSKTTKKNTCVIKKLKKGTKYYVRVRAAKTNYAGVTVYSKWTKKSVTTKK